jgi:hypothetical protein
MLTGRRHSGPIRSVSERCLEIHENSKLLQQNRDGDVAVKREDLAILQVEYVAARSVNLLPVGEMVPGGMTRSPLCVPLRDSSAKT